MKLIFNESKEQGNEQALGSLDSGESKLPRACSFYVYCILFKQGLIKNLKSTSSSNHKPTMPS